MSFDDEWAEACWHFLPTDRTLVSYFTRGDIGIIGASGTGIQEVSCLIAQNGGGISHAIGVGGRDLVIGVFAGQAAIDTTGKIPSTSGIRL